MRNSEEKLKRFPQGGLADGQSLRSEGDNSKFLTRKNSHSFIIIDIFIIQKEKRYIFRI
jgi:hypothetical protein